MEMLLTSPVVITSRLLPGVQVGRATISIEYATRPGRGGQTRYRYHIDLPGDPAEYSADDVQSGCQGGGLREGLCSVLDFLIAAGESWNWQERCGYDPSEGSGENSGLFPVRVSRWAAEHTDALSLVACEIGETPDCIVEGEQ